MAFSCSPVRLLDRGTPVAFAADAVATAARLLRDGEVVAIPTDTVYGLAASINRPEAITDIYRIKGREDAKNLPVLIADAAAASTICAIDTPSRLRQLAARLWPGALTVAFPAQADVDPRLVGPDATVGLRIPDDPVASDLIRQLEVRSTAGALAVTSANRSGEPALTTAGDVVGHLCQGTHSLRWVLDGGPRTRQQPSTVVGERDGDLLIHREGAVSATWLRSLWQVLADA